MVLVGLGVILVSLSVLIYKFKPSTSATKPIPTFSIDGDDNVGKSGDAAPNKRTEKDTPFLENESEKHSTAQERSDGSITVPQERSLQSDKVDSASSPKEKFIPPTMTLETTAQTTTKPSMPPPSRPDISKPAKRTPPKPSTSLRPPPSTASTLRAPPSRSLAPPSSSLAPSTSTLAPSARPSRKVLLDPGHSPLDWAHLTSNPPTPTFLRGADVPPNLIRVPPSLLRYHSGRKGKDAWGVYQGKVYNLSPYMKFHPGGVDQLMRGAGNDREGEKLFNEIHPWVSWENMLGECLVGILVSESEAQEKEVEKLEEMD